MTSYLPGEDTSQGRAMVSPTANLNASDRVMKRGSALFSIWLAASPVKNEPEKEERKKNGKTINIIQIELDRRRVTQLARRATDRCHRGSLLWSRYLCIVNGIGCGKKMDSRNQPSARWLFLPLIVCDGTRLIGSRQQIKAKANEVYTLQHHHHRGWVVSSTWGTRRREAKPGIVWPTSIMNGKRRRWDALDENGCNLTSGEQFTGKLCVGVVRAGKGNEGFPCNFAFHNSCPGF